MTRTKQQTQHIARQERQEKKEKFVIMSNGVKVNYDNNEMMTRMEMMNTTHCNTRTIEEEEEKGISQHKEETRMTGEE